MSEDKWTEQAWTSMAVRKSVKEKFDLACSKKHARTGEKVNKTGLIEETLLKFVEKENKNNG